MEGGDFVLKNENIDNYTETVAEDKPGYNLVPRNKNIQSFFSQLFKFRFFSFIYFLNYFITILLSFFYVFI